MSGALESQAVDYLEGLLEGFVAYDGNWVMTYMNGAGERLLGRRREDVLGKTWHQAFPHAVGNPVDEMYQRVMRTRKAERMEYFYPHYGRWLEISASAVRTGGVAVYFRDITEREALNRVGRTLASELDLERVVQAVTDAATALSGAQFGAFFYNTRNDAGESYMLYTLSGVSREAFAGFPMPRNTAVFGPTFKGEGIVRSNDITQDPRYGKNAPRRGMPEGHLPVKSYLAVPVVSRSGEVHGGLFFGHAAAGVFDERAERLVAGIAAQAAVAIDNARLYGSLQDSEQRLRLALDAGRMGTWEWNIPANRVTWSPALEVLHGLQPGTFAGTFAAYQEDIHPEDRERVGRLIAESLESGEHHLQYRIVRPDGAVRWVEGRGKLFRDGRGEPLRMVGVCIDITERQRAEEALRASEARYRAVVESQAELVCRFRPEGAILFANGAYARAAGTTPEAMTGRDFWSFIPEAEHAAVRALLARLTPASPEVRIENRFVTPEGERWYLFTNRALAFDAAGRVVEAQSTGTDITERKRAEEALREADRRKDEFLAVLAHELRNPLAPVRTGLHLLRIAQPGSEAAEQARAMMERQLAHLIRLVDDLLEVSRISSGKIELRRERVELAAAVMSALETSRPAIEAARHQLDVSLPAEPIALQADFVRLAQVIANLLNNAAKYTPPGGRIALGARREQGEAVVSVRDTGIGIPREALPRLFEMFAQVDGSPARRTGGLGIGLGLARRLVELHGGRIEASSEGSGKGAEFTVRLPLDDAALALPGRALQARRKISTAGHNDPT